jgi:hypothetical protein
LLAREREAQWLRIFATEEMEAADIMAQNQDLVVARARIQNVQRKFHLSRADVQEGMAIAARGLESVNEYTDIGWLQAHVPWYASV